MRAQANTYSNARKLRRAMTKAEVLLWSALRTSRRLNGLAFRRQHPLGGLIADFACTKAKLVIEVDGASHFSRELHDQVRENTLRGMGWEIIRFTEGEVLKDLRSIADSIYLTAAQRATERGWTPTKCSPAGGGAVERSETEGV